MPGEIIKVGHNLELTVCVTCGVIHAVPAQWLRYQVEHKGEIYCPSGHVNTYDRAGADDDADGEKSEDSAKVAELRKELVLAVHRAEQAEARAAEEARLNDEQTEIATRTPGLAIAPAEFRDINNGWRIGCPYCETTYASYVGGWFRHHMIEKHQWTEAQFAAAAKVFNRARLGAEHAK